MASFQEFPLSSALFRSAFGQSALQTFTTDNIFFGLCLTKMIIPFWPSFSIDHSYSHSWTMILSLKVKNNNYWYWHYQYPPINVDKINVIEYSFNAMIINNLRVFCSNWCDWLFRSIQIVEQINSICVSCCYEAEIQIFTRMKQTLCPSPFLIRLVCVV